MDEQFANLDAWTFYPEEQFWTYIPRDVNVALIGGGGVRLTASNVAEGSGLYPAAQIYSTQEYLYGFIEVRCKMPLGSQGTWAVPWLWPDAGVWDLVKPEIDIMEYFGGQNEYIYGSWNNHIKEGGEYIAPNDLTAGYHYYAIEWTPTKITFFYDDYAFAVNTIMMATVPMSIVLSNGVGENPSPPEAWPNQYDVDYVKVWQRAA